MAQIQDSTTTTTKEQQQPRRRSFLLGCFGSFVSQHKVKENSNKKKITTIISWFSWSKKSPKRTVPVGAATTEKLHQRKESVLMAKSSKKALTKPQKLQADSALAGQIPAAIDDTPVHGKKNKTRYEINAQKIILENTKSLNHLDSIMEAATSKKDVSKRNSPSQTSSPEDKHQVSRRPAVELSHSVSMPPPSIRKKQMENGGDGDRHVKKDKTHGKNDTYARKFDPFIGMSILMVTLIIMIVWGKLCAILCTSAWLYCYPLIKAKKVEPKVTIRNGSKSCDLDINSKEYKKKVVLEGFLDRNHRINGVGIL